jgi:hypothetical protein
VVHGGGQHWRRRRGARGRCVVERREEDEDFVRCFEKKYKRSGKWYRILVGWFLGRVGMGFGQINSSLLFFSIKFSFLFSVSGFYLTSNLFAGFLLLWLLME